MDLIKVSATSRTAAVAGAIAGVVRDHHRAEVQAIGAAAVNQAVKALVLADTLIRSMVSLLAMNGLRNFASFIL